MIGGSLWLKTLNFLERFDSIQVRYVGVEFRRVILFMRDTALASNTVSIITVCRHCPKTKGG